MTKEDGSEADTREKERFLALAERLGHAADVVERQPIKEELARVIFGSK